MRFSVFADFSVPNSKTNLTKWAKAIHEMGFTDVVIGLNSDVLTKKAAKRKKIGRYDFHLHQSPEKIIAASKVLTALGIKVSLMSWYHGDLKFVDAMMTTCLPLLKACGAWRFILDGEYVLLHHSTPEKRQQAADLFEDRLSNEFPQLVTGITSYAGHPSAVSEIGKVVDQFIPQAYSVYKPTSKDHWTHSSITSPGKMQRLAVDSWEEAYNYSEICLALPAYWLKRPGMSAEASFNTSIDKAADLGVEEVLYWSLKWLSGRNATFVKDFYKASSIVRRELLKEAIKRHT